MTAAKRLNSRYYSSSCLPPLIGPFCVGCGAPLAPPPPGQPSLLNSPVHGLLRTIPSRWQVKYLQSLIGYFQLDPNRVLDAIMEGFETQPDNGAYLQLLPHFAFKNTVWLLGFKLETHHGTEGSKRTPPALMHIAAALLQASKTPALCMPGLLVGYLCRLTSIHPAGAACPPG